MTTYQRLETLKNRPTRYELAASNGERRILIAYCVGRSRNSILRALRQHGAKVAALMCPTGQELITFGRGAADGATIGEWRVTFTGRTQREAIIAGELPWVGDLSERRAA